MENIDRLYGELCKIAPIELSYKMIQMGDYDNSGILIKSCADVTGVLFSLDLSVQAVDKAKRYKCNTIVTHHPAIYSPIKELSVEDADTQAVLYAMQNKMNVISMHLNLDVAQNGIDCCLAQALGAESYQILDYVTEKEGYGRVFNVKHNTVTTFVKNLKEQLGTKRVLVYGNGAVHKCASFCGSGGSSAVTALDGGKLSDVDLVVTSDMPHHLIKKFVESGKKLVLIPHYSAENYGFAKFYERVLSSVNAPVYYFEDKRFI